MMAMELVRSAPGVWAMSMREMSAVGVTVSTLAVCVSAVTLTVVETLAELELEVEDGRGIRSGG